MSSSSDNSRRHDESQNELWIEFDRTPAAAAAAAAVQTESDSIATSSPVKLTSASSKALEKLLFDAQKESSSASSRIDSLASSRTSPHSQHSPTADLSTTPEIETVISLQIDNHMLPLGEEDHLVGGNWVWDWSSRPEAVPPSSLPFKHRAAKKHRLSIRNTGIMRGIVFSLENLPLLVFTHACSFALGAASTAYYLRRFFPCSAVITTSFGS